MTMLSNLIRVLFFFSVKNYSTMRGEKNAIKIIREEKIPIYISISFYVVDKI